MEFSVESQLVHGGTERTAGAPLGPPLLPTSVYVSQGAPGAGPGSSPGYGRNGNPGWAGLEAALAAMEGPGAVAVTFASGQAASTALMLALAGGRKSIVFPSDGYYNTRALAARLRPHGADAVPVDLLDLDAVAAALRDGPAVLWAETPTNPLLRVADLTALADLAGSAGAPLVVDNTVATGLLQKPLDFGAAASVYSLTKSVSGHSDVLGGAVVTRDAALAESVRSWRADAGSILGPFECWLVLRGLKTLPLRIERTSSNALEVAAFLAAHPRVTAVHYPGLSPSALARKQLPRGFGPLLSFEIAGTAADADAVVAAARLIVPATSFGGVESSWERRARWPAETAPATLIRMSCGIEPAADLIADLTSALEAGARLRLREPAHVEDAEAEGHEHAGDEPEADHDRRFRPARQFEVMLQRRHLEHPFAAQLVGADLDYH
jgi:cystathionine beta-lyase/cystathionine gamma-synthase